MFWMQSGLFYIHNPDFLTVRLSLDSPEIGGVTDWYQSFG